MTPLALLVLCALARAHGDHAAAIQARADDESLSYAERQVSDFRPPLAGEPRSPWIATALPLTRAGSLP
jgi:hypothetical protein